MLNIQVILLVEYLERATTISKESTPKQVEARDTPTTGDDIV